MKIIPTKLSNVIIIEPKVFSDSRGCFFESFSDNRCDDAGIGLPFVQDNVSYSSKGVLRGLHYQHEHMQGKLIYVLKGSVFDVVVDIRLGSNTFGQWVGVELSEDNHRQLYMPPGFAHGFAVTSDEVVFIYKCTDYYHQASEITIKWDDLDLLINWPIDKPVLSEKDEKGVALKDLATDLLPVYREKL